MAHWTGHQDRLNRKKGHDKNGPDYAYEELVADLTSAFLCAFLGLQGNFQHTEYLAAYAKILSDDPKVILKASGDAQRAFDLIHSFQPQEDESNDE